MPPVDPTSAILGPWAQFGLVGSVTIALGVVVIYLWRALHEAKAAHLAEVKACNAQMLDLTIKKIEADNSLAKALEGLEKVVDTALEALRK